MKTMIERLGLAAVMVTTILMSPEAHAQGARPALAISHPRWIAARDPLPRYDWLAGCAPGLTDVTATPQRRCCTWLGVTIALDATAAPPDFSLSAEAARNQIRSVDQSVRAAAQRRLMAAGPAMLFGLQAEPTRQFQLKREMLLLLARLSGMGLVGRAAAGLTPTSTIREFVDSDVRARESARATYLDVEVLRGPDPRTPPLTTEVAYAGTGAALFLSGLGAEKLLHHALGDAFVVHPQLWPVGIEIKSSFAVP